MPGFFGTFTKKLNAAYDPHDKRKGGKFIRHSHISRNEVVLCNVSTWVDRQLLAERAADELEPHDCLRVKPHSLKLLSEKVPELTFPAHLPRTHAAVAEEEHAQAAKRARRDAEGDDPPPPIPQGYVRCDWTPRAPVLDFMLWTRLDRSAPQWYQGVVVRQLHKKSSRRSKYTHDAKFTGYVGVRGVQLTQDA